jgi:hypothetical protein
MKRILLLLSFCASLLAQPSSVTLPQPDCTIGIGNGLTTLNQVVPSLGFNNIGTGCDTWAMSISVSGFSSATVALQSAPNNNGVPGTWVTFAGQSIFSPSPNNNNPITSSTEAFVWLFGYNPWVRVQLTALTGSGIVTGSVYGWRNPSATASGGGGSSSSVTIISPIPLPVNSTGNASVVSNQQAVTASAVALASNAAKEVCVHALIGNTINVYLGGAGVSDSTGMELPPGGNVCLHPNNTNLLYVIASTTGASVSWIATN